MNREQEITGKEVDILLMRLKSEAEQSGYHLNPDGEFTRELVRGLLINESRYGYRSCPCRLAAGFKEDDLDIICPCDYRDQDVTEYNTCYCGLYVSREVINGTEKVVRIPERRPALKERKKIGQESKVVYASELGFPIWRCSVCGYLCARYDPPEVCPICKASKERFKRFI